eukprot:CAMPEP_0205879562 /NCGR_PEP_ID=MMETSP1083-20121108/15460_1 /ASSEMBLY_ACC=CAM_ASM_000430 /TAXON_ID=97485 /ORGANISM="Prymnesium parvum, Strain Texoma1" /LENGTH=83 /DNA_ID=CAMNT_0053242523 /DNA_START=65 /DNA_END=316 /DNA_ORIENTATION=-
MPSSSLSELMTNPTDKTFSTLSGSSSARFMPALSIGCSRQVSQPAFDPHFMSSMVSPTIRHDSGGSPQELHAASTIAGSGLSG